ncbi:hypothetical protein N1851_006870 [Merluccius polli]|uniref:Uncharacterized protein n=1 Tax=Merluccius polli TaxID=89951 RepID=A0AA47N3W8_MERPO|nr:hypothetical protein N1851_006870 [Merluccius polli]
MAIPSKKAKTGDETVVGHLHSVSPIKTSRQNARYFEAMLQTGREEYNRVVCFASEKRTQFLQAAENSQAVKLVGTRKGVSYSNPGGYDILVSSHSRLDVAGDLSFPRRVPRDTDRMTIAEVLALGPRQRVGVIEVRVLQATASKVVQVQGTPVELKSFEVCDQTAQTGVTVWDRLIPLVQEGNCYRFETLTTRKEGDRTVLCTTLSTVITITTTEVGQPASLRPVTARADETVRGPVTGVQIVAKPRCRRCHAGQENLLIKLSTHRCERCAILQHTAAYMVSYSGVLIVIGRDGEERSMTLTNSAVLTYVKDHSLSSSALDVSALEETVIATPELEVTVNHDGMVVRFAALDGEAVAVQSGQGNVVLDTEEASTSYAVGGDFEGVAELLYED